MEAPLKKPYTISFQQAGDSAIGFISIAEKDLLPFAVKRVFWTYYTPHEVHRGGHAHRRLEEVLVAAAGIVKVFTEMRSGDKKTFTLDNPNAGLFLPPYCWRKLQFSHNAVLVTMASIEYDAAEYIRDYDSFKNS